MISPFAKSVGLMKIYAGWAADPVIAYWFAIGTSFLVWSGDCNLRKGLICPLNNGKGRVSNS
jgi:hypothetical protein